MHHTPVDREAIATRIRLLVGLLGLTNLSVLGIQALTAAPADLAAAFILVTINLALLGLTYGLRRSPYALSLVFINLTILTVVLAAAGPLSGTVDGSVWTLFQVPPLIATIVLNQRRATLGLVTISAVVLTGVAVAEISGIIPVTLEVSREGLWTNLVAQLVTLGLVGVTISLMEQRARQALSQARDAEVQVQQQLQRERELVANQEQLNLALQQRLNEIHARDVVVAQQQTEQQQLRAMLSGLAAPVIPVLAGVVVMPLIGDFDAARAEQLSAALLEGVTRHRARVAVLDVTGVQMLDQAIAQALLRAAAACQLLGTTPILVGISPEAAQTLTSLNVDLTRLHTSANLQAGIATAMRMISQRGF